MAEVPPREGLSLMATPEEHTWQTQKENGHRKQAQSEAVLRGVGCGGEDFCGGYFGSSKAPFIPLPVLGHSPCTWEPAISLYLSASEHFSWRTPRALDSSPLWGLLGSQRRGLRLLEAVNPDPELMKRGRHEGQ